MTRLEMLQERVMALSHQSAIRDTVLELLAIEIKRAKQEPYPEPEPGEGYDEYVSPRGEAWTKQDSDEVTALIQDGIKEERRRWTDAVRKQRDTAMASAWIGACDEILEDMGVEDDT